MLGFEWYILSLDPFIIYPHGIPLWQEAEYLHGRQCQMGDKTLGIATAATVPDDPAATTSAKDHNTGKRKLGVDLGSHMGLRGVAAIWVMVFHCFRYSTYDTNILEGSILM